MSLAILYFTLLALLFPGNKTQITLAGEEPVKIGLLIPDSSQVRIIQAAEQAIEVANANGGLNGRPFKLVVRSTEGPWGAGSKESVSLVYDEDVRAIVGSLDGRNAHLAEQVAAKSHLVYLETRATDPTLSQAYVPWFLRIVPSDDQQARAILQLISNRETGNTAILSSEEYDTQYAVKSLTTYTAREGNPDPLILMVNTEETNNSALVNQLVEANIDHLIIPFYSEESQTLVTGLRDLQSEMQIYGTLSFLYGLEQHGGNLKNLEGMILIHSYEGTLDAAPDLHMEISAGYTRDGINLVVEAILHAGLDHESIRDYIADQDHPPGTTGPIQFDDLGNRTGEIRFIQMVKGEMVVINLPCSAQIPVHSNCNK